MHILNFFIDYILVFLVLISILVFVHEYGHYLFAKLFKVKVESFSIGFGKELWGWTDKSGTRWKIAPFPLGGYVKMKGEMLDLTGNSNEVAPDSFESKQLWQKFLIVFAGPLFNIIFPAFIFFFISYFVGYANLDPTVGSVLKNAPAHGILQPKDIIKSINGKNITTFQELQQEVMLQPNEVVQLEILRQGKKLNVKITTGVQTVNKIKTGILGVTADNSTYTHYRYSVKASVLYVYRVYKQVGSLIINSFYRLFSANMSVDELGGPVKIAQISGESFHNGFTSWLFFMAILSLNLAVINLLPIPALDGGYLLIYIFQAITRKKLQGNVYNFLLKISFSFLIALMIFMIFNDVTSILFK
ncbi:Metalloprotease MmpA [Candidatus Hepatincola sp. Pdp]